MNYSNMDKMKYLNGILLIQFKNHIQTKYEFKMTERDNGESLQESIADQSLNDEKLNETTEEISNDKDIQILSANEIEEKISSTCKEEKIRSYLDENNPKLFLCYICNKKYNMNFHLKQHIKSIHEKRKNVNFYDNTIHNDQKLNENEIAAKFITNANNLNSSIIHEDQKVYKCEPCGKSYSSAEDLKRHIHTDHEDHKDHKCEYCSKSFSLAEFEDTHSHSS